jgi:hypothetical protein
VRRWSVRAAEVGIGQRRAYELLRAARAEG